MPLDRVHRVSLAHSVGAQLCRAIVSGDIPAGTQLSEPALAARLGVSRAPIREALIELELRGLVEFDPQGRTRVPRLTPADLAEIHAVRSALDPLACGLAARHATPESLALLEETLAATRRAKTLGDVSRLDMEFHDRIVAAARNRRLSLCWNGIRDQLELWLTQMHPRHQAATKSTREKTVDAHRKLLDAIRRRDDGRATDLARAHVAGWLALMPATPALPDGNGA